MIKHDALSGWCYAHRMHSKRCDFLRHMRHV
jgi:hypothetical protein